LEQASFPDVDSFRRVYFQTPIELMTYLVE